ncbi:MAG: type IV conjugative transfer system protein TraL [Proteobacteria bacterium]|nr:type IV conjugative transfer system protein TraL [Pseudomonadota bacterium]
MSQQQEDYSIPSHLDDSIKFFMWDMDEAMAFLAPLGMGIFAGWPMVGGALGLGCAWALTKLKKGRGTKFIRHVGYWYLPFEKPFKGTRVPPSHIREYTG